jgi:succinate dehydrogenase hydrophobic anchor subunit
MLATLALILVAGVPASAPQPGDTGVAHAASYAPRLDQVSPQRFSGDAASVAVPALPAPTAQRARVIQHSDFYYTRLKIHRISAVLMAPLFVAQYFAGKDLYDNGNQAAEWAQDAHRPLAASIAALYGINAVTGVWNAIDDWKSPGRARRTVHGALMLLAGAGFVAAASMAPETEDGFTEGDPTTHRNLAIASMSTVAVSGLMMLIWK